MSRPDFLCISRWMDYKSDMFSSFSRILNVVFLFSCSEPFESDRHDLLVPRIIGVRSSDGYTIAQVWNGSAAHHENSPKLAWFNSAGQQFANGIRVPNQGIESGTVIYTESIW